jgi:hypothetical protein
MCCNNAWCYIDMSHCEWAVCGCESFFGGFIVVCMYSLVCNQIKVHYRGCRKVVKSGRQVVRPWMGSFHNWHC